MKGKIKLTKICRYCGDTFTTFVTKQMFCNRLCFGRNHENKPHRRIYKGKAPLQPVKPVIKIKNKRLNMNLINHSIAYAESIKGDSNAVHKWNIYLSTLDY